MVFGESQKFNALNKYTNIRVFTKHVKENLKNIVPLWHLLQVVQVEITIKKS